MTRHERHQRALSAFVDGELSVSEVRRLEEHLAECDECRVELQGLERLQGMLRQDLLDLGPVRPPVLWPGIRARIEGGRPEGFITAWVRRIWETAWERPKLSIASATVVVFLIVTATYLAWEVPDRTVPVEMAQAGVVVEAVEPEPGFRAMVLTTSGQGLKVIWVVPGERT